MALLSYPDDITVAGLTSVTPKPRAWGVVRAGAVLTGGFVATDYWDMSNYSHAALFFNLTQGSITDLQWKVFHSWAGVTWFQRIVEEVTLTDIENAAPPDSMAVSGDFQRVKVVPVLARFLRLEVAAVGTVAGSSLEVIIGGV